MKLTPLHHVLAYVALLALTALTFGLSFLHLGPWGPVLAMAIATGKAALVAAVFMHLVEQRFANTAVLLTGVLFVLTLLAFAALDVATR